MRTTADPQFDPTRLTNAATGDRLEFLLSPLLGDGERLVFRCTLSPRSAGSPPHRHRALEETFAVERGVLSMSLGGAPRTLGVGQAVHVHAGVTHAFRNDTDAPVTFVSTVAPGAGFERFLRAMFGLAADGLTTANGLPKDPRVLALVLEHADLVLAGVPGALQAPLLGSLAWLGRAARLTRALESYWPAPRTEASR